MNLTFNVDIAKNYKSNSQKSRIVTETWLGDNMYCPICGNPMLFHHKANSPVADFFCNDCKADFELKSKKSKNATIQNIIPDGAYSTMIERIISLNNPNLFVMTYFNNCVSNLIFIPNFFFVPEIIIKRPPLKENARRAGWIGCNINIGLVPNDARIYIIEKGTIVPSNTVIKNYCRILSLQTNTLQSRGWIMDTMACIDKIPQNQFTLQDLYAFESELKIKYPNNNFIKDKLRQQLQILRDKGFIEFTTRGNYRKIKL